MIHPQIGDKVKNNGIIVDEDYDGSFLVYFGNGEVSRILEKDIEILELAEYIDNSLDEERDFYKNYDIVALKGLFCLAVFNPTTPSLNRRLRLEAMLQLIAEKEAAINE